MSIRRAKTLQADRFAVFGDEATERLGLVNLALVATTWAESLTALPTATP